MTGHKIFTLSRIRATVILGNREIRHIMRSEGQLPNRLRGNTRDRFSDKTTSKMRSRKKASTHKQCNFHPFKKVTLTPHSETIVQAITHRNRIGIVSSEETKRVFIGNCLVEPEEHTCPISIINTMEE